jgi:biopolymer transport protein ExbD
MSVWRIRHEGSPESIDRLSAEPILEGVIEGHWEPTDEVRGPDEAEWIALERHPRFAEAIADLEMPFAPPPPDETRLDMNPLIDVALVLLIFFILTTTYQELRKMFPAPPGEATEVKQTIGESQLRQITIRATAKMEAGTPVIRVEDEIVPPEGLREKFEFWKQKTGQSRLAIEMDRDVPWKVFMAIQDAAAGAKIQETIRIERPSIKD